MWTVIQTGLLYDWILNSTLQNVVSANSAIQFDYIGFFQENALVDRWFGEKTKPSHILLDERRHTLSQVTNLRVRMLGIWNVNLETIPKDFRGRKYNFQNDMHQLENLRLATTFISTESAYVLRVREDVGWYSPFILPKNPIQITFKKCGESVFRRVTHHPPLTDKMWYGPREAVSKMHTMYLDAFMHERVASTEWALTFATRNLPTTQTHIGASDARIRADGTLCWKRIYACGANMSQKMFC